MRRTAIEAKSKRIGRRDSLRYLLAASLQTNSGVPGIFVFSSATAWENTRRGISLKSSSGHAPALISAH
jgi:hypothetical protein